MHDAANDFAGRSRTDVTRLEQLRIDAGLSRLVLGEKAGVYHGTIRRLEEGGKLVQVAPLAKLAAYFDVPASELLLPAIGQATTAVDPDRAA
jgi:transcriptional regulator with XRE-family HTH domain